MAKILRLYPTRKLNKTQKLPYLVGVILIGILDKTWCSNIHSHNSKSNTKFCKVKEYFHYLTQVFTKKGPYPKPKNKKKKRKIFASHLLGATTSTKPMLMASIATLIMDITRVTVSQMESPSTLAVALVSLASLEAPTSLTLSASLATLAFLASLVLTASVLLTRTVLVSMASIFLLLPLAWV